MPKSELPKKLLHFKSSDKENHQLPDYEDLANCCTPVFLYNNKFSKLRENKLDEEPISS